MKRIIYTLMMFAVLSVSAFAQTNNKPDAELTKDEAVVRINEFTLKVQELTNNLTNIEAEIEKMKVELDNLVAELKDCNKKLYELIQATEAEVAAFEQRLGQLEGKVRAMK